MDTNFKLISKGEAARLLGVSRRTISRLVARGTLPTVSLDQHSRPRIRYRDLLELIERKERDAEAGP